MPFFNPNLPAPTAFAVSRFHDTTSFFNDPPPYVLSAPIEALETYLFPSVPASRLQPLEEMDSEQHGDLPTTPGAQPSTTEAPERFSPEEEERLLSAAQLQKASGNTLFATNHYLAAIDAYNLALASTPSYLDRETSILHSNLAACHLKLSAPTLALSHASEAITRRSGWSKPLVRRCKAREMLGTWKELEAAVAEYEALLEGKGLEAPLTEAEKKECKRGLERCRKMLEEVRAKEVGEAMKGLRSLGDGLLRPFGMSTSDFGMAPDGKGGYSLQFKKGGGGG